MLLERDDPLAICHAALTGIAHKGGHAIFVAGEAGIGKSALLECFAQGLPKDQPRAMAICDPLDTPRPMGAVRDLDAMLSEDRRLLPSERDLFDGFLRTLQGARGPVVLMIEDLHWADQRSLDWVQFIGRRLSQLPVLLIASFRDDEIDPGHALHSALGAIPAQRKTRIDLAPLSVDAIRQLGGDHPQSAADLREITGGNPFYLTEIMNHDTRLAALPVSVADAVNARLNGLSEAQCRFLETLSCCPGAIPFDWIRQLEDGPAHCDVAVQRRFLILAGDDIKFRHELLRLAVYQRLPPAACRAAHGVFLDLLLRDGTGDDMLGHVVHHATGAHRNDVLLREAPRAAAVAARLGAHREAARYLGHLLPLLPDQPADIAAELYESWAYEAGLALRIDEDVIAAREQAVSLWRKVGDTERVGENLRWLSRMHWYRGEAEIAQRYVREAIAELEGRTASPARARAYALRAQFHMLQDQMPEAITWGEEARAMAGTIGDDETFAHALNTIGSARMFRGDATGEGLLRESLAISLERGLDEQAARVYTNLSECLVEARDLQAAADLLEEGIAFDTAHDLDAWTFYLIGRKAHLFFEMDRYGDALQIAEEVLTREGQTLVMRMPALIVRARTRLRLDLPDAITTLRETLEEAGKIDEPQYLSTLHIALIEAAVLSHEPDLADEAVGWLERLGPDHLSPRKRGEAVFWSRLADRPVAALSQAPLPDPFQKAARGQFTAAADGFRAESSGYLALWSQALIATPDALRLADRGFAELGVTAARHALRRRFDIPLGSLDKAARRSAAANPYALTRAELTVLAHLVDGKSNALIAETLCRSRRTVENHVASIFSKLRCHNRVEVVLRCQSEPWILPR